MKKIAPFILLGILLFSRTTVMAQLKVGSEGIFIQSGTVFSTDGLTMVPSNDWGMNNLNVVKEFSVVIWPKFNSIVRMYRFSRPVTFQGELALSYQNEELNGNEGKNLALAYSRTTSSNYKDFTIVKESVANAKERYVGQLFTDAINFSDLTAVTMISTDSLYKDLIANNMLTPNGDDINDKWVVKNIEQYPNNELKILDREGRVVYTRIGYDNSWDGKFNGNPLPEDTYYYILILDSGKGKKTGFITIVKDK